MDADSDSTLLQGVKIISLALNVPGPVAAARLTKLGAKVVKIEPPGGDATGAAAPAWYESLCYGQTVLRLNLKTPDGRAKLDQMLADSDLLLASFRPSALHRMGLDWESIHSRHPKLCFVGIIGYGAPLEERTGHDLTYQSDLGLLRPPQMPPTLFIDLAGAERAVSMALALLNRAARSGEVGCAWISLYECARDLAAPLKAGLTSSDGLLGGGYPLYGFYRANDGWIAIAALEPHFAERLLSELGLEKPDRGKLQRIFQQRKAASWEKWAAELDLPLVAVRETG
ncbi:MAG TPA: CaiB/BaiF CoA-transferase family protein [Candidatus Angelobacter sp.]|jgi:crotonobetainyl-CoA:carnitine CoA-transferase CaiB-like acyl-CoA transferase|nr:CaiB/BaiF CoA-transferase family protein [Candidatus Angelobacter sp.]